MDLLTVSIVKVTANLGPPGHDTIIDAGGHRLHADEPLSAGGSDTGPAPYDFLLAGLGACTSMTLRMYAAKRRWPIAALQIVLRMSRSDGGMHIDRTIAVRGLNALQRAELAEAAETTPVTLTLRSGATIGTVVE